MKPAAFAYHAPTTIDEALTLLAADPDAKILAGGQSLVPAMNFRLARPTHLIDIGRLSDLSYIRVDGDQILIGALTRHHAFEKTTVADPMGALLRTVTRHIGHLPIRVRGTFGGSLAHADPAAEWCVLALTLGADIVARSVHDRRVIAADEFFNTVFTTALRPDEVLVEVRLPVLDAATRVGFQEFSRRAGDFALAIALTTLYLDGDRIQAARVGLGGVVGTPVRAREAEQLLEGERVGDEVFAAAADAAAANIEPWGDIHGSPVYRKDLVRAMVKRALTTPLTG